jgi:transposase InsO family protein
MDTHISDFRKIKIAHVTTNTFSGFLVRTAIKRERTKNVISHCLHYFSMLGVPNQIKADNGTGYYSQAFEIFCQQFSVTFITGIFFFLILKDKVLGNFKTVSSF